MTTPHTPTLSTTQAARAGRCSRTTIHRLVHANKIAALPRTDRDHYAITSTREEIAAAVASLPRRTGYHHKKRNNGTAPPAVKATSAKRPVGRLAELAAFLALPQDVREALFVLANRCSLDDLRLLIELTDAK